MSAGQPLPSEEKRTLAQQLAIHWKGHLFQFGKQDPAAYSPAAGLRLLLVFIVLELVIGPRLGILKWFRIPGPPTWIRIPVMLAVALLAVRYVAGVKFSEIGLKPWSAWSATEKSYFVQLFVITHVVFISILGGRLREVIADPGFVRQLGTVFFPYLLWGFYQELMYRGILQTELARRWGTRSKNTNSGINNY